VTLCSSIANDHQEKKKKTTENNDQISSQDDQKEEEKIELIDEKENDDDDIGEFETKNEGRSSFISHTNKSSSPHNSLLLSSQNQQKMENDEFIFLGLIEYLGERKMNFIIFLPLF